MHIECDIASCEGNSECGVPRQETRQEHFLSKSGSMSSQVVAEAKEDRLCRMGGVGHVLGVICGRRGVKGCPCFFVS